MQCKTCGGKMEGDGFTIVLHCEFVDLWDGENAFSEPDAAPIYCVLPESFQHEEESE